MKENIYLKVVHLQIKRKIIDEQLAKLRPRAARELRRQGLSYDSIASALNMGKVNVLQIVRDGKRKLKTRGKSKKEVKSE